MKISALLPMKDHSERIPNKNMRMFAGRPLYHCVASVLQASELIDTIIINTDSTVIADDAIQNFAKARIISRPEKIRGDFVEMNTIIDYDLSVSKGEHFLQTHSTNPLLTLTTLNKAIHRYFAKLKDFDSLFAVTRLQTRLYWESGNPLNHNPHELLRTQDLPSLFEENSNFYIFSKKSFKASGGKRIGLHPTMYVMEKLEAVDIDEEADFVMAELFYKLHNN